MSVEAMRWAFDWARLAQSYRTGATVGSSPI